MMTKVLFKMSLLFAVSYTFSACDPNHEKKCEWYIEPDLAKRAMVESDEMTVCLRNYDTGKQRCSLKTKTTLAKSILGKKVRYSEVEIKKREILSASPCTP